MKRSAVFLILVIAFASFAHAESDVNESWVARYATDQIQGNSLATEIKIDASGNVYVSGVSNGTGGIFSSFLIKHNGTGEIEWANPYKRSPEDMANRISSLAIDGSGNAYIAGERINYEGWADYAAVKYNSSGEQEWTAYYDGPLHLDDEANAIAVDPSGNVYVAGSSMGSMSSLFDFAVVKYDPSGLQQWVGRYNGPGNNHDEVEAVAVDYEGNIYVVGLSIGSGTSTDMATIKYNGNGEEQWVKRYEGPTEDVPSAIAVDASGNVYITGASRTSDTEFGYVTIKYDHEGNEKWIARYDSPENCQDDAVGIVVDLSGNVYVTGTACAGPYGSNSDYATVKYDSEGREQWVKRFNGPAGQSDRAAAIAVDREGSVYVTGQSAGEGTGSDYATVKYSSAGDQEWVVRYNSEGNLEDAAVGIAVDDAGNVYVTGTVGMGTNDSKITTIKYVQPSFPPPGDPNSKNEPSPLMPSPNPSCTQVGDGAGRVVAGVGADEALDYLINISNRAGVSPMDIAMEWLLFGVGSSGQEAGPFFLTPSGEVVPFTLETDPIAVAFPFDHSGNVNRIISCIPLGPNGLGLEAGSYLWYGYAYSPTPVIDFADAPNAVLENIVIMVVQ